MIIFLFNFSLHKFESLTKYAYYKNSQMIYYFKVLVSFIVPTLQAILHHTFLLRFPQCGFGLLSAVYLSGRYLRCYTLKYKLRTKGGNALLLAAILSNV